MLLKNLEKILGETRKLSNEEQLYEPQTFDLYCGLSYIQKTSFSPYLEKIHRAISEGGLVHLSANILNKLASPLLKFGSVELRFCNLEETIPELKTNESYIIREAISSDLDVSRDGFDPVPSKEDLLKRFQQGELCFVATDLNDKVVHSRWASKDIGSYIYIQELNRNFTLRENEAYMYNSYTRPDMRGLGLDWMVTSFTTHYLKKAGCKRIYCYTRGDSPIAIKVASRWTKLAGRLWYVRFRNGKTHVFGKPSQEFPILFPAKHIQK